ncbi:efflux transporter periplasmic adaptor subunit [Caulobacter sp. B11]|uniref:efflux RND transporter periplasmic adaptor subunit n=1 Tax=Caulobacter sp. B11 TaxID=2048899 RepID=UPI000C12A518|nr:efflux RND transporter periplasmic adaptor subunit [Caulobacter sp. B11]PHY12580.1 efflux transporter periplasmic adaptor subunit [Caulobacter sp. B11]
MDKTPGARAKIDSFLGVKPGSRRPRSLMIGALIVGVALVLLIVFLLRGSGVEPRYATAAVERGDLRVTVSATGNLAPTNKVEVGSELSGIVSAVHVENNDRVTKGQILARLDTSRLEDTVRESEAGLASAQASVAQAQATLTEARASLGRMEEVYRLSSGKAPSATELDVARAAWARAAANERAAQAAVGQARASLSSNRTQLSKALIRSPVNGVVLSRDVEPGSTVAATLNAPVLFTLAEDLAKMQLEVKVDEADVGQVKDGQRATFQVDAYPGRTFKAVVKRLDLGSTTTASSSGSGQVVAYTAVLTAENPDLALRPGMTGTAAIVATEKANVLLVPNAALRFTPQAAAGRSKGGAASMLVPRMMRSQGQGGDVTIGRGSRQTVYVLGNDGEPRAISVLAGDSNGSQTEVAGEGLKVGMKVVTGQLAGAEP